MTKDKDWTIQFVMILEGTFKPINVDKRKEISIVALVLENTFDNCVAFTIIGHLNRYHIVYIQMALNFVANIRCAFIKVTSRVLQTICQIELDSDSDLDSIQIRDLKIESELIKFNS